MWSPNELLKTEKQRDILSYITLQFFPFKKVPLEHYPNLRFPFHTLFLLYAGQITLERMSATVLKRTKRIAHIKIAPDIP